MRKRLSQGQQGHATHEWRDALHQMLLRDSTPSWIRLLPRALRRIMQSSPEDTAGRPDQDIGRQDAEEVMELIDQRNKREVEEIVQRQPANNRGHPAQIRHVLD